MQFERPECFVADDSTQNISYDNRLVSKISLRLIPFMLVLYVVSYLDRINISFASLQMNKELQLTDMDYGFGSGIFFVGYCLFGIPSNLLIEKIGPRKWISAIMILWGMITVVMSFMRNAQEFYILRFILGFAEAGFFPGMILYLTYWFSPRYYGAAVARFMTAIPVAGLLGSGVAAWALSMTTAGLSGWKWLFILTGLPAVVLGVAVLFFLPDRPRNAKWLTAEEIEAVESVVIVKKDGKPGAETDASDASVETPATTEPATTEPAAPEKPAASGAMQSFFTTLREFLVWRFALLYFTLTVSMYGFQLWLPQIIKAFGDMDVVTTALLSAIPALFQALGMLVIAGNSDRTGERRFHVVIAACCTCSGLALSCFGGIAPVKLAGLCLAAFGIWGSVGPFWALTTNSLKRESHATGIAVINSIGNLGGFAGPSLVGFIKTYSQGFNDSLIALAVASVLAGTLAVTSPRNQSEDQQKQ